MKKRIYFIIFLVVLSFSLFAAETRKPRLYLKFSGIGSIANGGDFNDFIDRNDFYLTDINNSSDLYTISTSQTSFFRGFAGEIGVNVKSYAVGISFGYIEKNFHIDYHYADDDSDYVESYTRDHTFSAIPIFLYIHYKIIGTRFLTAYLTLGEGVYLAKYRDDRSITYENFQNESGDDITFVESYIESKKNRLGFHLGTTIDLNITGNFSLSIEAAYRFVSFKEMVANSYYKDDVEEDEEEGDFYYWINSRNESAQFTIGPPTNKIFWGGEPAKLNLNGFSFSIGIKITFGSRSQKKVEKIAPPEQY